MSFTDQQLKSLSAKLQRKHVRTREENGTTLSYLEGWHVISEANRIFGFDAWDRQTLAPDCLFQERSNGHTLCAYSTKVRITVRAGTAAIVREGLGIGFGKSSQPEAAHEIAIKASETDATKRAFTTFGNAFGLALYDHQQLRVTGVPPNSAPLASETKSPLVLNDGVGTEEFQSPRDFCDTLKARLSELPTTEAIYQLWELNLDALAKVHRHTAPHTDRLLKDLLSAFRVELRRAAEAAGPRSEVGTSLPQASPKTTSTSAFLYPKEKRVRNRSHLSYVGQQPCLICGRRPAHAHHVRFAQPRALSMKVSDEYTVPLCATHHDDLHRTGDEKGWWARHGIKDPLKFAARLWAASRGHSGYPHHPQAARLDTAKEPSQEETAQVPDGKGA